MDLCWELASLVVGRLAGAATVVDEIHGFRYFDERDLLGFVDGTENPTGQAADIAVTIGAEDPAFAGGTYVIVQKYLHDMAAWDALSVEEQERVIGRAKLSNVEMDDDVKPSNSHVALNTIIDPDGTQRQILRENMPFGSLGDGEFGTYFIGYAATPSVTELMLQRMFLGDPPGQLRPDPRFLHCGDGQPLLRAHRRLSRRSSGVARCKPMTGPGMATPAPRRRLIPSPRATAHWASAGSPARRRRSLAAYAARARLSEPTRRSVGAVPP